MASGVFTEVIVVNQRWVPHVNKLSPSSLKFYLPSSNTKITFNTRAPCLIIRQVLQLFCYVGISSQSRVCISLSRLCWSLILGTSPEAIRSEGWALRRLSLCKTPPRERLTPLVMWRGLFLPSGSATGRGEGKEGVKMLRLFTQISQVFPYLGLVFTGDLLRLCISLLGSPATYHKVPARFQQSALWWQKASFSGFQQMPYIGGWLSFTFSKVTCYCTSSSTKGEINLRLAIDQEREKQAEVTENLRIRSQSVLPNTYITPVATEHSFFANTQRALTKKWNVLQNKSSLSKC